MIDDLKKLIINGYLKLIDAAHQSLGQKTEVVLWDHVLNSLDYYPDEFRTGPGRTLDEKRELSPARVDTEGKACARSLSLS